MIKLNGKGCWLLANYSRNMVSTYTTKQLVNDDFEIKVNCKVDWQKIIKSGVHYTGVVCFNGAHFGILCKYYNGYAMISAEVWSEHEGENIVNEAQVLIRDDKLKEDDWTDIRLIYKKNKSITIETNEGRETTEIQGEILDYSGSYLWVGCCDNHKHTPKEFQGDWYGEIRTISVEGKERCFADYDFDKKTRYKCYDNSGNGNHLIAKHLNEKGFIIIY